MDELIPKTDPNFYLWLLLGRARHLMTKARQKELRRYDITSRQAYTLLIIDYLGSKATIAEISKYTYREIHTISAIISRMAKDGLINKIQDTPKSTRIRFEITDKGRKAFEMSSKRTTINNIMEALSDKEQQQLNLFLDKLIKKSGEVISALASD